MISEFRADELVTNLYTAVEYGAKRLKPRQIQEWSNRLQRAAPREREKSSSYTYCTSSSWSFCSTTTTTTTTTMSLCIRFVYRPTTRHNGDSGQRERERESRRKDLTLDPAGGCSLPPIHTPWKTRDRFRPCHYSIVFVTLSPLSTLIFSLLRTSVNPLFEFQVFPIPTIFFPYIINNEFLLF